MESNIRQPRRQEPRQELPHSKYSETWAQLLTSGPIDMRVAMIRATYALKRAYLLRIYSNTLACLRTCHLMNAWEDCATSMDLRCRTFGV